MPKCLKQTVQFLCHHILGPRLPHNLYGASMITHSNGKAVVLFAGYNAKQNMKSKEIIQLNSDSTQWTILEQKLNYGRDGHLAMSIPDDFTNCTSSKIKNDGKSINSYKTKWFLFISTLFLYL